VRGLTLALLGAPLLLGCRNVDRFDTEGGAAYCGEMINFGENGFVRGEPNLAMQLELDTDSLTVQPGVITTSDRLITRADGTVASEGGVCTPLPLFDAAALRAIPEIMGDQLSLLEFGDGREYNFFAWVDSTCLGTVVAVVSLMKNDTVEIRLLKPRPAAPDNAPVGEQPGFILFRLNRGEKPCKKIQS
jgi:hypothetical protein